MTTGYDIIGLIGSFIISAGLVPQVSKVYRTKSAEDISYSFLAMYNGGLALILIYGIGESLWPIYIPCSLELAGALVLLVMKLLYRNNTGDIETGKSLVDVGKSPVEVSKSLVEVVKSPVEDAPLTPRFVLALTPK
jgi:MtN3 and saliva related transmembrane protein